MLTLDFNPVNQYFVVKCPRNPYAVVEDIIKNHGLDFSTSASTPETAVLMTQEAYAAVAFWEFATARAQERLATLRAEIDESWRTTSGAHIKCPADVEPWPFQKAGVEYALKRRNTLIADQPGLGKTIQAICFANEINAKRVLVLCPANVRLQWARKIQEWSTMAWPFTVYPILNSRRGVHPDAHWTICSYDLARTSGIGSALSELTYDLIICDEIHYLKTIDAARTRAVFGGGKDREFPALVERTGSIMGLSGTPLPNRPREAYTVARGLCWDAIDWMSEDAFGSRFNPLERTEVTDKVTGQTRFVTREAQGRHGELQARLRSNFMVRREKHGERGVLGQLHLPTYEIVHAEETKIVQAALKAESLLGINPEDLLGENIKVDGQIAIARHMMGLALAPQVIEWVQMLLDGGEEKILVYAHHKDVLDKYCEAFGPYGVVRIDGSLGPQKKQERVDDFVNNPFIRVCAGNLIAMGTGTDGLQAVCQHVVFGEADWVPGVNLQGVDRLDRAGQRGKVMAEFIVAPGSLSEFILANSLRKARNVHKALDAQVEA